MTRRTSNAPISPSRLGRIFKIRYDLYQWKFFVKFLNNFLAQVTPFLFYAIGGYLALQGRLDIGQLVAVISAYKDLPSPIKELIDWDQQRLDVQVKYAAGLSSSSMSSSSSTAASRRSQPPRWRADGRVRRSSTCRLRRQRRAASRPRLLEIKPGEKVAIVGTARRRHRSASPKRSPGWSGRNSAASPSTAAICSRCRKRSPAGASPMRRATPSSSTARSPQSGLRAEAFADDRSRLRRAGSRWSINGIPPRRRRPAIPTLDLNSDWVDYEAAGASGPEDLLTAIRPVLDAVLISQDILDLALRSTVNTDVHVALGDHIVDATRNRSGTGSTRRGSTRIVVPFDLDAYNAKRRSARTCCSARRSGL